MHRSVFSFFPESVSHRASVCFVSPGLVKGIPPRPCSTLLLSHRRSSALTRAQTFPSPTLTAISMGTRGLSIFLSPSLLSNLPLCCLKITQFSHLHTWIYLSNQKQLWVAGWNFRKKSREQVTVVACSWMTQKFEKCDCLLAFKCFNLVSVSSNELKGCYPMLSYSLPILKR